MAAVVPPRDPHPAGAIREQGHPGRWLVSRWDHPAINPAGTHNRVAWADSLSLTGAEHQLLPPTPQAPAEDHGGGEFVGIGPLQVKQACAAGGCLLQMGLTGQQLQTRARLQPLAAGPYRPERPVSRGIGVAEAQAPCSAVTATKAVTAAPRAPGAEAPAGQG